MPNWCENELTVSGPASLVDNFLAECGSEQSDLDFNKFVPMPESLTKVSSGSSELSYKILFGDGCGFQLDEVETDLVSAHLLGSYDAVRVRELNKALYKGLVGKSRAEVAEAVRKEEILAIKYNANVQAHGHPTWYGWAIANWGTKWNASEASIHSESSSTGKSKKAVFCFNTAWSPPVPVVQAMISQNPNLRFVLRYWESGCAYKGVFKGHRGEVLRDETSVYRGSRGG